MFNSPLPLLLALCALTLSGCGGKTFKDILSNPSPEEQAALQTPPLVIPPDFMKRPLSEPPKIREKEAAKAPVRQGRVPLADRTRDTITPPKKIRRSPAVPRSLSNLPTPKRDDEEEAGRPTRNQERRKLGAGNNPLPTLNDDATR